MLKNVSKRSRLNIESWHIKNSKLAAEGPLSMLGSIKKAAVKLKALFFLFFLFFFLFLFLLERVNSMFGVGDLFGFWWLRLVEWG